MMRRSWLFVAGADEAAHESAARSGADVIVLELEDFTPPELRPKARALSRDVFDRWRKSGAAAAVRINPLETCGNEDLLGVLAGRPDIIMMSKVERPEQVKALDAATGASVELVPNIESADMVVDLGTARSRGGEELAYVRERFLVECRAAGVEAIDCPYTFSDVKGAIADARYAKKLGYRMKSLVDPSHAKALNAVFTPSSLEIRKARRIVAAFEKARAAGKDRAKVGGALIEVPVYAAAKRLLSKG